MVYAFLMLKQMTKQVDKQIASLTNDQRALSAWVTL